MLRAAASSVGDRASDVERLVRNLTNVRITTRDLRELCADAARESLNIVRAAVHVREQIDSAPEYFERRFRDAGLLRAEDKLQRRADKILETAGTKTDAEIARANQLSRYAKGLPVTVDQADGTTSTVWYRKADRLRPDARQRQLHELRAEHRKIVKTQYRMQMEATPRVPPLPTPRTLGDTDHECYLKALQHHKDTVRSIAARRERMQELTQQRTELERRLQAAPRQSADDWTIASQERERDEYSRVHKRRKMEHAARTAGASIVV